MRVAEDEAQARIVEDLLHARRELVLVGGEIEPRGVVAVVGQAIVGEHVVDAEVAGVVGHVVDAGVAEMGQHVGVVQARHRDFADAHLQERAERADRSPACPSSMPKPAAAEKLPRSMMPASTNTSGMLLADVVQAAGAFQVVVEDAHARQALARRSCRRGSR